MSMSEQPEVVLVCKGKHWWGRPNEDASPWCVFFEVDGRMSYWLMDNSVDTCVDEVSAWRRFLREWDAPECAAYKAKVALKRGEDEVMLKFALCANLTS